MSTVSASCFFPPSVSDSRLAELPGACWADHWRWELRIRKLLRAPEHESTYQALSVTARGNPWIRELLGLPLWPAQVEWAGNSSDDSKHCGRSQVLWDQEKGLSFPILHFWPYSCCVLQGQAPGVQWRWNRTRADTWLPTFNHLQTFTPDTELSETQFPPL